MGKFLFCDMDGTLIDDNQEIHPKNIELMREWQKHNHNFDSNNCCSCSCCWFYAIESNSGKSYRGCRG